MNNGGWICLDYDPQGYQATYATDSVAYGDWMDFTPQVQQRSVVWG
jgi:hypothetical protein